jgi:hypothetical protein
MSLLATCTSLILASWVSAGWVRRLSHTPPTLFDGPKSAPLAYFGFSRVQPLSSHPVDPIDGYLKSVGASPMLKEGEDYSLCFLLRAADRYVYTGCGITAYCYLSI